SASSSSASNIGSDVYTPCPISDLLTMTVTLSSVPIRTNAFGANGSAAIPGCGTPASLPALATSGKYRLISNPPPAAAPTLRKERRFISLVVMLSSRLSLGEGQGGRLSAEPTSVSFVVYKDI